jgi:hypothetical protein
MVIFIKVFHSVMLHLHTAGVWKHRLADLHRYCSSRTIGLIHGNVKNQTKRSDCDATVNSYSSWLCMILYKFRRPCWILGFQSGDYEAHWWLLVWLTLLSWRMEAIHSSETSWTSTKLHGVTSQKTLRLGRPCNPPPPLKNGYRNPKVCITNAFIHNIPLCFFC